MKKKLITIILALVMMLGVGGALAGCNKDGGGSKSKTTIYLAAHEGAYGKDFWSFIKTAFEEEFEEEGYKVNFVTGTNIHEKFQTQLGTPASPDIVYMGTNQSSGWVTSNLVLTEDKTKLLDISSLLNEKVPGEDILLKDKFMDGAIGSVATNPFSGASANKTYMLPLFYSLNGVFYNKDLVDENNLPKTWGDMATLNNPADGKYVFSYPRGGYLDNVMVAGAKSALSDADFVKWTNQSDASIYDNANYRKFFNDLGSVKAAPPPVFISEQGNNIDTKTNTQNFYNGKIAYFPCGSFMLADAATGEWVEASALKSFNENKLGYMPYPASYDGGKSYFVGLLEQVYCIKTGNSAKQEVAKKFASFLYSDKAVKIMADYSAIVPVKNAIALAEGTNIDKVTLNLYKNTATASISVDSFPAKSKTGAPVNADYKQIASFGLNEVLKIQDRGLGIYGEATTSARVDKWVNAMKDWVNFTPAV